jgi:hypothetical protein
MGAATKGGVKILINDGSNRETGTYVGYGPKQRFIGETGQAQVLLFYFRKSPTSKTQSTFSTGF